jgi:hypothetical protein
MRDCKKVIKITAAIDKLHFFLSPSFIVCATQQIFLIVGYEKSFNIHSVSRVCHKHFRPGHNQQNRFEKFLSPEKQEAKNSRVRFVGSWNNGDYSKYC